MRFSDGPHLEFGPFPVAIGRVVPTTARGWISRGGYNISLVGEADIAKTLRTARTFGLPALQAAAEGSAQIDLQIAGSWAALNSSAASGFSAAQVTGTTTLHNVHLALSGVGGQVEIVSADMQLSPDEVHVSKLNAIAADTSWTGSLVMPRGCGTAAACPVHFKLNANQIALGAMREWVSPNPEDRPWYRVLQPNAKAGPSFVLNVRASGEVTARSLQVQSLKATGVSAKVALDAGKLRISDLTADFMGGRHRGEWQADFNMKPSVCKGSGSLTGAELADVADAMKDGWIAGSANASYEMKGPCPPEFWTSAEGTLQFEMTDGSLPHVFLAEGTEPLEVTRFVGQARLQSGKIEMNDAKLDSPDGKFQLTGTATLNGELDLNLARTLNSTTVTGYTITGTVEAPRVSLSSSETQARLKSEPPK